MHYQPLLTYISIVSQICSHFWIFRGHENRYHSSFSISDQDIDTNCMITAGMNKNNHQNDQNKARTYVFILTHFVINVSIFRIFRSHENERNSRISISDQDTDTKICLYT